jgi:CO/xanthine dehydrogenase Mo-binding subunit
VPRRIPRHQGRAAAVSGPGADEVRHVGDAIAFVVAESIEAAKDAAEAIAIDWEPLPRPTPVVNAILDALWRAYRIQHLDMPATPERL